MTDKFLYLTEWLGSGVTEEQEISIRLSGIVEFIKCRGIDKDSKVRTKILLNYPREGALMNGTILVTQEYEKIKQLVESGD